MTTGSASSMRCAFQCRRAIASACWRSASPRSTGDRRKVFQEIYAFWYGTLSAYAHHRLTALQLALFADEQFAEETFLMVRSVTAFLAIQSSLCVLSEAEHAAGIPVCTHLR